MSVRRSLRVRLVGALGGALGAAVLTVGTGAPAAQSLPPLADDGYRTPPAPETFADSLWWRDAMRLPQAHRDEKGAGATVAVIDDQVAPGVPELRGQDVRLRTLCGAPPLRRLAHPHADHGTSMVALVAGNGRGTTPGGRGIPGVAPGARVLFYSADRFAGIPGPDCTETETADMIDQAVRDGADVISISLGLHPSPSLRRAVRDAVDAGVVVVASAGDTSSESVWNFPAEYPGVVAVGAVDEYAQLWRRSPRGVHAAVAAPGVYVSSGYVTRDRDWSSTYAMNGTSPATAITAGALALVKAKYPEATGNQLIQHLIHTPGGGDGYDWQPGYGFGIVNVTRMLASSPAQWPDENPLLTVPTETLRQYPMWVSSRVPDPAGSSRSGSGAPTDARGPARASAEAPAPPGSQRDQAAAGFRTPDDTVPAWAWPVAAVAVLGGLAGAVAARRRGTPGRTERTTTQGA